MIISINVAANKNVRFERVHVSEKRFGVKYDRKLRRKSGEIAENCTRLPRLFVYI